MVLWSLCTEEVFSTLDPKRCVFVSTCPCEQSVMRELSRVSCRAAPTDDADVTVGSIALHAHVPASFSLSLSQNGVMLTEYEIGHTHTHTVAVFLC